MVDDYTVDVKTVAVYKVEICTVDGGAVDLWAAMMDSPSP